MRLDSYIERVFTYRYIILKHAASAPQLSINSFSVSPLGGGETRALQANWKSVVLGLQQKFTLDGNEKRPPVNAITGSFRDVWGNKRLVKFESHQSSKRHHLRCLAYGGRREIGFEEQIFL